ncbi:MAG: hypothetical protein ACMXX7_01980 [Candidatus Woesearchaeota archaeon]
MYIKTISKACPLCKSDVKGNQKLRYLCKECNITYKLNQLLNQKITKIKTTNPKLNWLEKNKKEKTN